MRQDSVDCWDAADSKADEVVGSAIAEGLIYCSRANQNIVNYVTTSLSAEHANN